jgi:pyruvate,water dikinase
MTPGSTGDSSDQIIHTLQERAKELNCLYRVHELLARPDAPLDDVCRGLLDVLPPGWQYPGICWARIVLDGTVYQPPRAEESPWVQRAEIVVSGEPTGRVEVFYTKAMPPADEGPFLKEERRLIDTIAERLGHVVMQRRLQGALRGTPAAAEDAARARPEWWVIVEFLRHTDRHLLMRISRRMINYLCWNGIDEAQALLQRFASRRGEDDAVGEDNRPLAKASIDAVLATADEAFRIAANCLDHGELLNCLTRWIKDDKSGFLMEAVENQGTSLTDIGDALERYQHLSLGDRDLSRTMQLALRVALVRRFFTDDLEYINRAKHYVEVDDFHPLVQHIVSPAGGHGKLGGKSSGVFLAHQILRKSPEYADTAGEVKVPRTWYLTSDGLLNFIEFNHLEDVYDRKYLEIDQIRREYPHIVQVFKHSSFAPEIIRGLSLALDDLGDRPLVVRSSSLLEDRIGAAFSGKYKSLFLANRGTKDERLDALMDAIAEVYASVFSPDPIEYRAERGLLDLHEEMGVMIQEVVGSRAGRYFLPAYAGVVFSNNEFRWSARIRREDGLIRLVPGLGTRAVDRTGDDYPVLIAPGQPGLRVNVTADEVVRYSPRKVDVINLETRQFETIPIRTLLDECGGDLPALPQICSVLEDDRLSVPMGLDVDPAGRSLVVTFEGLLRNTPFLSRIRTVLRILGEKLGYPVDLEFASDGRDFYLLQCRPQSFSVDAAPSPIPADLPPDRVLFSATRFVSNGRVPELTHIVYVDPDAYGALPDLQQLEDVGRAIGRLNKLLPKRQFALLGPGRWGSRGDIRLGVSVTYSDISNTALLVEIAASRGGYVPEVSFGTHFFQDLVEAGIRYLPIYPDEGGERFNRRLLERLRNVLPDLVPDFASLAHVVRVVDVPASTGGLVLRVLMNGDLDRAVGHLAPPDALAHPVSDRRRGPDAPPEDHWRWRLRMAEQIAAAIDAERFGVKACYVFGSTKNATAGPASDIDLLIHVTGDEPRHRALETWLEGWSLCLAEINFLRSGCRTPGLLDVHYLTDDDIARKTSYAVKIGAVTDPARRLPCGTSHA